MSDRASLCEFHDWGYVEHDGETWNECASCGFRELWAGGVMISTTDGAESERLGNLDLVERAS